MKAFEGHWDFTGLSEHVYYHPDVEGSECIRVLGINRKEERQEGWRACAEWIQQSRGKHIKDSIDVLIEQELEERE